jgi:hypothetical protein
MPFIAESVTYSFTLLITNGLAKFYFCLMFMMQDIADSAYRYSRGRPQLLSSVSKLIADTLFSVLVQALFLVQVRNCTNTSKSHLVLKTFMLLSIYIKAKVSDVRTCLCVARQRRAVSMQRGRFLWSPFWAKVSDVRTCLCVARQRPAVAMQWGRFLWSPFWGCCLATTISWWCFLFGPVAGQRHNSGVAFSLGSVPRTRC